MPQNKPVKAPIIVALDTPDLSVALAWIYAAKPHVAGVKCGLEFFVANGPQGVARVAREGLPVFLDLKFNDVPNTMAAAVRAAQPLNPALMTVHASSDSTGMEAAMKAARQARDDAGMTTKLLAVTVLTSFNEESLKRVGQQGPIPDQVQRLADLAQDSGMDGFVCSAWEAEMLRERCGKKMTLVVPGVRPAGAAVQDQKRVATPEDAFRAGANYIVVGRPITGSKNLREAAADMAASVQHVLPGKRRRIAPAYAS